MINEWIVRVALMAASFVPRPVLRDETLEDQQNVIEEIEVAIIHSVCLSVCHVCKGLVSCGDSIVHFFLADSIHSGSRFQCGAGQPVPPRRLRPPCGPISHPQKVSSNHTGY